MLSLIAFIISSSPPSVFIVGQLLKLAVVVYVLVFSVQVSIINIFCIDMKNAEERTALIDDYSNDVHLRQIGRKLPRTDLLSGRMSTEVIKTNRFVYTLTAFSAIGGFLFGYDTGVVSGALIILKSTFHLSTVWQELIVSATIAFAAIFALIGGPLNSVFGRRIVILFASFVFVGGSAILAAAMNKEMLLAGRAVVGIGIGLASMTVPMYIAEVSPAHIRGRLVTVNNLFITGGQFVASCVDGFFSADKQNGWRFMLGLAAVPALIQFVGFLFLPETPRWLIQKEKYERAKICLQKISENDEAAEREFQIIKTAVEQEQANARGLCSLLSDVAVRRALVVGCGLQMFQQLAGINTVMYYSASIIQMSGVRNARVAIWLAAVTAFCNFLFTIVGVWLVERLGRRLLSLASIAGVTLALGFLSCGFFLSTIHSPPVTINSSALMNHTDSQCFIYGSCAPCVDSTVCGFCYMEDGQSGAYNSTCVPVDQDNTQVAEEGRCKTQQSDGPYFASNYCPTSYSWMTMAGMIFYLAMFAPGMGPMPWTVNSEIYPQWARSAGNAFSAGTNWTFNVLVSLTFLSVTQAFTTEGAFLFYACLAFLAFIFIFLFLPETRGKPLEEIESLFRSGWIVPGRKEPTAYHVILNHNHPEDTDEDTLFET